MKKSLLIGSIMLVLGLLIAGLMTPVFAHGPDDGGAVSGNNEAWEAMHEACESGDWEAMVEAAEEVHGEDFDYMHHYDEGYHGYYRWCDMDSHMGRGMMGW